MAFTPTGVEFIAKGLSKYLGDLDKADKAQGGLGSSLASIGKGAVALGATATIAGITAIATGLAAATTTAISFESAFAGVIKTTDGLTDSTGELNDVGKELREGFVGLSKDIPLTFEELAGIGEIAGQLGVGKDALVEFTNTAAALGVSTNLSAEDAATSIARMQNIYQVAADDVGANTNAIGSAIVALGNNFATTERDIVAFAERIAGAGQIVGLSESDVLAIGTALSSVGVEAEAGGTAVQKVLLSMNEAVNGSTTEFTDNSEAIEKNVDKLLKLQAESARLEAQFPGLQDELLAQHDAFIEAGGSAEEWGRQLGDKNRQKAFETATAIGDITTEIESLRASQGTPISTGSLETFASVAGMTADEFKAKWETDAAGAFQDFVEGLGTKGDEATGILDELGLADQRLIRSFLSLSGAGNLLERTFTEANTAFEEGTALQDEAAARYATTESKIQLLKNTIRAMGDAIGMRLLPFLNTALDVGQQWLDAAIIPIGNMLDTVVIPAIDNFTSSIQNLFTTTETGESVFSNLFDPENLATTVNTIIADIPNQLTNLVTSITDYLTNQWPLVVASLQPWIDNFWTWAETVATNAGSGLLAIIAALATWASSPETQAQLTELGNTLATTAIDGLIFAAENYDDYISFVTAVAAGVGAAVLALGAILAGVGAQILAGIWAGFLEKVGIELEPTTISELGNIYGGVAQNALTAAKIIGTNIILAIVQGLQQHMANLNLIKEIKPTIDAAATNALLAAKLIGKNTVTAVVGGVEDFKDKLVKSGKSIVDGLIDGMKENAGAVLEYIKGLMGDVAGAVDDWWQNNSPSKVAAGMGKNIILGFARGVSTNSEEFRSAVLGAVSPKNTLKDLDQYNKTNRRAIENFFKKSLGDFGELNPQKLNKNLTAYADQFGIPAKFLKEHQKEIDYQSKRFMKSIEKVKEETRLANLGQAIGDAGSFASFGQNAAKRLGQELAQLQQFMRSGEATLTIGDRIITAAEAQDVFNQKLEEQKGLQEDLQQLAKSQAELDFLQQQLSLLDLVRQRGLDVKDIFGGITFGLNASIPDLVAATNRVVQGVVGQVNADVQAVNSPVARPANQSGRGGVNIEQVNINNGMDAAMFTNMLEQQLEGVS